MYSIKLRFLPLAIYFIVLGNISAQNTLGTLLNTPESIDGYTLFTTATETYLINNCGEVINQWSSAYPPGNAVYLLENGNILRAAKTNSTEFNFGGAGGRVELYNWDGDLLWGINYDTPNYRQHHDVFPMPNGNILILAATLMSEAEALQAGRDPSKLVDLKLYNESIIEIEPLGTNNYNVVWEWNVYDHFIQDYDSSKDNFGMVNMHEELLDINFINGNNGGANWLHVNSIQYNATLDQIILSSRNLSEIYIIDHSTTTVEASSHSGGIYGKGGDFLYRWGNPQSYKQGDETNRKLFGQHYPHWIPDGLIDEGKIILYNNGSGRDPSFSEVFILELPTDSPGNYSYTSNTSYGPDNPSYIYSTNSDEFFSQILSSAQRLSNGNTLICMGRRGHMFEIDADENIVWEYIVPVNGSDGTIFAQGETASSNQIFRALKYNTDYPAFIGRDLTPGDPIELNPDLSECYSLHIDSFALDDLKVYPNPASNQINIQHVDTLDAVSIFNTLGALVIYTEHSNVIDIAELQVGVYFLKLELGNNSITKKIIKQ